MSVENIAEHQMHSEFYRLTEEAAAQLNDVRDSGGKIIAVGTTSIRTLETIGTKFSGEIKADSGWTDIFITPGYEFIQRQKGTRYRQVFSAFLSLNSP